MNTQIKQRFESFYSNNVWEDITLGNALTLWSEKYSGRIALSEAERQMTYDELEIESKRIASGFERLGFVKGDKIVLQIPNTIEFVTTSFALFKLGVIPVMALPAQRKSEIKGIIEKSDAKGYVIKDKYLGFDYKKMAQEILLELDMALSVIVIGENDRFLSYDELRERPELQPSLEISYTELGLFLLSGGTTGVPKLIPRRHADYLYVAKETAKKCHMDESTVYLAALPIAHNFSLCCPGLLGTLSVGGRVVICYVTSPDEILPLIEEEQVTITGLVPAIANICIEFLETDNDYDLSSLKIVQVGGSVLDSYLAAKIERVFNCKLQQIFGIAEGLICCTDIEDYDFIRYHTQGKPISEYDEVLIVDENGKEVLAGEYGELIVRGPYTIYGYYNIGEMDKNYISDDCYFKTGDKARRLEDGNYQIVGRLNEMINRGGEKITPSELEEILLQNNQIEDVQVVGIKDKDLGEKICVFILDNTEKLTLGDIRNYLRARGAAAFKQPDQLVYVNAWPLTNVGKIDRNQLRLLGMQKQSGG